MDASILLQMEDLDELLDRITSRIVVGEYHLVLGSGASYGATNAEGRLPGTEELKRLLLDQLDFDDTSQSISLARAYEAMAASAGTAAAENFLRQRFANSTPADWHYDLIQIPWRATWTLNVDDVMEFAAKGAEVTTTSFVPSDRLVPLTNEIVADLPMIHLHGYVGALDSKAEPEIVFSIPQYSAVTRSAMLPNWHNIFRSYLPTYPVVVLGASLSEEIDIADVLRYGNSSYAYGAPSVIVRPDPSEFDIAEYSRWGFETIALTGEEFVQEIERRLEPRSRSERFSSLYTRQTFVPLDDIGAPSSGHDFYGGHEPQIQDIRDELDSPAPWLYQFIEDSFGIYDETSAPTTQILYLLSGRPYSGKSTALFRIAHELDKRGWKSYFLGGAEALRAAELAKFFESRPNGVLFVDDAEADSVGVQSALGYFRTQGRSLRIVAAERAGQPTKSLVRNVGERFTVGVADPIFVEPNQVTWTEILKVRDKSVRNGVLDGKSEQSRKLHFIKHDGSLFSALASLEDGDGFITRIEEGGEALTEKQQAVLAVSALAASKGLTISTAIISAAVGVQHSVLVNWLNNSTLAAWVEFATDINGHARLRHRYIGDLVIDRRLKTMKDLDIAPILNEVCVILAETVNSPHSIALGTYEARLVGALMNRRLVMRVLGSGDVDKWYESLGKSYSWNARFWEQRALAISDTEYHSPNFAKAFSYATRAVTVYRDANSLNTLGTVLMRRALGSSETASAVEYWAAALTHLKEARDTGKRGGEHPYVTFFQYSRRLHRSCSNRSFRIKILGESRQWRARLAESDVSVGKELRDAVSYFTKLESDSSLV